MKNIPVYLFVGFLESGKTRFIQDTLCDIRFNNGEKTLLLVCEEGIDEYEPSLFSGENVFIETIDSSDMLTPKYLQSLQEKSHAERVIIEYNGMWLLTELFNNLPQKWQIVQSMMFADAQTFISYNSNMRNQTVDKLKVSELVVFNRMDKETDKLELHKIVRAVNRRADIAYEYTDSSVEYDDIIDPLPFDINLPLIEIQDTDYAIWYRDLLEESDKYNDKMVKFKAIVASDKRLPDNIFAAGRHVMTCCIDDVEYMPVICISKKNHNLKSRDWVILTGKIKVEYSKFYKSKGPVIYLEDIILTSSPKEELATFY